MGRATPPGEGGFTLLEVMMATSLLAVGAVSVLIVLATAAGYAGQRQTQQRLTQVLEEARNDARTRVNAFRPSDDAKTPGGDDAKVEPKSSSLYSGFQYELAFAAVNAEVPEAGFEVTVTVTFGDQQSHAEVLIVGSDAVAMEEFESSTTFELEREGRDDTGGGRETR
jgi:prepilin-type N-terminal cleavage/methylation domain-containing protein